MAFRTHYSNEVDGSLDGKDVTVAGWAHEIRDMGKLKFLLLRDRGGLIQITAKKETTSEGVLSALTSIPRESVVRVDGKVIKSPKAPKGV